MLRLHALAISAQTPCQMPPPGTHKPLLLQSEPDASAAALSRLRARTLSVLSAALAGDELAAEYALLVLLGRVFSRADDGPRGLISLNISGCPQGTGDACARESRIAGERGGVSLGCALVGAGVCCRPQQGAGIARGSMHARPLPSC